MASKIVIKLVLTEELYEKLMQKYPQYRWVPKATAIKAILMDLVEGDAQ